MSLTVLAARAVHDNIASKERGEILTHDCQSIVDCFSSKKHSPLEKSIEFKDYSPIERIFNYIGIKKAPAPEPHFTEHLIDHLEFYHKETELIHYFKNRASTKANRLKAIPDDLKYRYLNIRDNEGKTALHWAGITGCKIPEGFSQIPKEDIFSLLAQQDNMGYTTLHYLAEYNDSERLIEIFELLSTEEKLNLLKIQNEKGHSLFHLLLVYDYDLDGFKAAFKDLSQDEKDLLITLQNNKCFTSLHPASAYSTNKLSYLIDNLSKNLKTKALKMQTAEGKTALHYAAKRREQSISAILQEFLDDDRERDDFIKIQDNKGKTALHFASKERNFNMFTTILQFISSNLEEKAQLKIQDNKGRTVLHYTITEEVIDAILQTLDDDEKTDFIKIQDKNRKTALHHITERSSYQIDLAVKRLLEDFSDNQEQLLIFLKQQDDQGKTALHYATNNSPEMVKIILESIHEKKDRAELIKIQDNEGRTALLYAANYADKTILSRWFLNDLCYLEIQDSKYNQLYLTLSMIKKSLSTDDWNEIKKIKDKKNRNMDCLVRENFIPFVKNHCEGLKFSVCNAAISAFYSIIPFFVITAEKILINKTPIRNFVPVFDNNIFRYSMIAFKGIWITANCFKFVYREKELVKNRTYKTLKAWKFLISEKLNRS